MKKFFCIFNLFKDVESYDAIQKNIIDMKMTVVDNYLRVFGKEADENLLNRELHENDISKKADAYWSRWIATLPSIILWIFVSLAILDLFLVEPNPASQSFLMAALVYLYLRQSCVTRAMVFELERIKRLQGIDR